MHSARVRALPFPPSLRSRGRAASRARWRLCCPERPCALVLRRRGASASSSKWGLVLPRLWRQGQRGPMSYRTRMLAAQLGLGGLIKGAQSLCAAVRCASS